MVYMEYIIPSLTWELKSTVREKEIINEYQGTGISKTIYFYET